MSSGPGSAYEKLSLEAAAKVDAACDGFEKAWKAARGEGGHEVRLRGRHGR